MKRSFALMAMLCLAAICPADTKLDDVQTCDERILGLKVIENLLDRNYMLYYGDAGLHYAEACTGVGALRIAENIQDKKQL